MQGPDSGKTGSIDQPRQLERGRAEASASPPLSLAELFTAQESALLIYARKIVNNDETAQDVVQEAFVKLHGCFETVQQPRAWLYRTVHNLAMNQLRSQRRLVSFQAMETESGQWPDPRPLPDDQIARLEAIGQTRLCLEVMDARSRELIRLKFEEGLSYQQMSQRTQLTVSHVGYLLHHALKQLASDLKKLGFIP